MPTTHKVLERLIQKAVLTVFGRRLQAGAFAEILEAFGGGLTLDVGESMPAAEYERQAARAGALRKALSAARRDGPSGPGRRRDGVRPRGPAPQPEAQQGPRGRRPPLPGVMPGAAPRRASAPSPTPC